MNLRTYFDLDDSIIYLNSGTQSIAPREVNIAVESYRRKWERNPTDALINAWPRLWQSQKHLGGFLKAGLDGAHFERDLTDGVFIKPGSQTTVFCTGLIKNLHSKTAISKYKD